MISNCNQCSTFKCWLYQGRVLNGNIRLQCLSEPIQFDQPVGGPRLIKLYNTTWYVMARYRWVINLSGWSQIRWNLNCLFPSIVFHHFLGMRAYIINSNLTIRVVIPHDDVIKLKHFPLYWPFYERNSLVTGEFSSQRPVTRSFDVFFDLRLNKQLSKRSWGWWFETPSRSLWRRCNGMHARLGFRLSWLYVQTQCWLEVSHI